MLIIVTTERAFQVMFTNHTEYIPLSKGKRVGTW